LQKDRLAIDPCVPRWWRDFEIIYRRGRATYRIKVENPLGVSRGVVSLQVDGQTQNFIELLDDDKTHNVHVLMGEPQINANDADQKEEQTFHS
jgi:cyclic beta-1,2-glucan synthetase